MNDPVKEYVARLPKKSPPKEIFHLILFARKDLLYTKNNFLYGDWSSSDNIACAAGAPISVVSISTITAIEDIGPCENGQTLVRATIR